MSAAAQRISGRPGRLLSARQLREGMTRRAAAEAKPITLYYGSLEAEDVLHVQAFGQRFQIPPDAEVTDPETDDQVRRDGTIVIRDVMGVEKWNPAASRPGATKNKLRHAAHALAAKILERRQERGVIQLTGDPEQDEELKRAATAQWIQWRRASARKTIMTYRRQQAEAQVAGLSADPMGEREMLAERFLEDDKSGFFAEYLSVGTPFVFRCKERGCGRQEKDAVRFRRHLAVTHELSDADIRARYLEQAEDGEGAAALEGAGGQAKGRGGKAKGQRAAER